MSGQRSAIKPVWVLGLCGLLLGGAGCSDDSGGGGDAAPDGSGLPDGAPGQEAGPDGRSPDLGGGRDLAPPDAAGKDLKGMGEGCEKTADCQGADLVCLVMSSAKKAGVCTVTCTPDNTSTTLINEDDCPGKGFRCASILMTSGDTKTYCLQECTPSFTKNPCPASTKLSCNPSSTKYAEPFQGMCFYTACTSGRDCPVYGSGTCYTDNDCKTLGSDAFCEDNLCARPGNCTAGGICGKHAGLGSKTAKVGDPCDDDFDCPENGRCIGESDSTSGAIGRSFRNGYCTVRGCMFGVQLPDFSCPAGTVCNNLYYGGYCFKACDVNSKTDCRGRGTDKGGGDRGGDYECYDWTNWTVRGYKVAAGPVCIDASTQTCDSHGKSRCDSLGDSKNSSNMSCRDRFTGAPKAKDFDPTGVCLDDTASGPFSTSAPDSGAGGGDAGAAEAGGAG